MQNDFMCGQQQPTSWDVYAPDHSPRLHGLSQRTALISEKQQDGSCADLPYPWLFTSWHNFILKNTKFGDQQYCCLCQASAASRVNMLATPRSENVEYFCQSGCWLPCRDAMWLRGQSFVELWSACNRMQVINQSRSFDPGPHSHLQLNRTC